MSHEFESGMFSNNEPAWHGLGNVLEGKVYNLDEALQLASMNWTVDKAPLYYKDADGNFVEVPNREAVLRNREGTLDYIDTVSGRYQLLQNRDAFKIIEPFLHEKECFISSVVSLCGGKKVCLVAQIEDNIREVVKNDPVASYILVATSHNGSMGSLVKYTNVRTVCQNTLTAALLSVGEWRSVRHTKSQLDRLATIQQSMDIYRLNFESDVRDYRLMSVKAVSTETFRDLLENVFKKELTDSAKSLDIPKDEMTLEDCRITKNCLRNFNSSPDLQMEGVAGTGWAAFNAITEAIKDKSSRRDSRYESIWFGDDSKKLAQARQATLALV